jgi:hypothetical protein
MPEPKIFIPSSPYVAEFASSWQRLFAHRLELSCEDCDFTTLYAVALKRHRVTHSGELLRCSAAPDCQYETNRGDNLRNHVKSRHENVRYQILFLLHVFIFSVVDPDPHWFWSAESGSESRRGKMTHKKKFHDISKCWMFSFEGCTLDVLYGGLKIRKIAIFYFFPTVKFSNLWSSKR